MEYIPAKTIVTKNKSTYWLGSEYNMNIYKGCNHGCIYCDSRSDCYQVNNFDTVKVKENALEVIRNDLRRKVKTGVINTGAMSDPYNIFEKELKLTRNALELINAYEFGVSIVTKSDLIVRDIDILKDIKLFMPVLAGMTITCINDDLSKIIEPNVTSSSKRFEAIKKLSDEGIYSGILMMPILPFINDNEENIIGIVRQAKLSGAKFIYPNFGVTLRSNQRHYYYDKLDLFFPKLKEKYIKEYGIRYNCTSKDSKKLYTIFKKECDRLGLLYNMKDIVKQYRLGYLDKQLSLF